MHTHQTQTAVAERTELIRRIQEGMMREAQDPARATEIAEAGRRMKATFDAEVSQYRATRRAREEEKMGKDPGKQKLISNVGSGVAVYPDISSVNRPEATIVPDAASSSSTHLWLGGYDWSNVHSALLDEANLNCAGAKASCKNNPNTCRFSLQMFAQTELSAAETEFYPGVISGRMAGILLGVHADGSYLALAQMRDEADNVIGYNVLLSRCKQNQRLKDISFVKLRKIVLPDMDEKNIHWIQVANNSTAEEYPLAMVSFPGSVLGTNNSNLLEDFGASDAATQTFRQQYPASWAAQMFYEGKLACLNNGERAADWAGELKGFYGGQVLRKMEWPQGPWMELAVGKDQNNNLVIYGEVLNAQTARRQQVLAFSWCPGSRQGQSIERVEVLSNLEVERSLWPEAGDRWAGELRIDRLGVTVQDKKKKRTRLIFKMEPLSAAANF